MSSDTEEKMGVIEACKRLFTNGTFLLNACVFMILWGDFVAMGNVLTPLFEDQYTPTQIAELGVSFILGGTIGCYLMGLFIDKT